MSDEIQKLEARIAALEVKVRSMNALARGPKGEDGRDGKDGKDGRDGRIIHEIAPAPAPALSMNPERPKPTCWAFDTDAKGRTIARPIYGDAPK